MRFCLRLAAAVRECHCNRNGFFFPLGKKLTILCKDMIRCPRRVVRCIQIPRLKLPSICGRLCSRSGNFTVYCENRRGHVPNNVDGGTFARTVFECDRRAERHDCQRERLRVVFQRCSRIVELAVRDRRSQCNSAASRSRIRNRQRRAVFAQRDAIARYGPCDRLVGGILRYNRCKLAQIVGLSLHNLAIRNIQRDSGHRNKHRPILYLNCVGLIRGGICYFISSGQRLIAGQRDGILICSARQLCIGNFAVCGRAAAHLVALFQDNGRARVLADIKNQRAFLFFFPCGIERRIQRILFIHVELFAFSVWLRIPAKEANLLLVVIILYRFFRFAFYLPRIACDRHGIRRTV